MINNNMNGLVFASILPIIFSVFYYILDRKTSFGKINYLVKQIIYGISFGLLSILGSELGYSYVGVQINCRDAAPVCAGLLFGPLAGIIAGLMGGIERWFAVYWGAGTFTRLACSLGTIFAGLHAAFLRKFLFKNKRPFWLLAVAVAVISEVIHLILIIVTNFNDVSRAFDIINSAAAILVVFNSFSVGISSIIIQFISKGRLLLNIKNRHLNQVIQRWTLLAFAIAFFISTWFLFTYQTSLSRQQASNVITSSIKDVEMSIEDSSSIELLNAARSLSTELDIDINELAKKYNVSEINVIDSNGIIIDSTNKNYINFDMHTGEQSREFLTLLDDKKEIVQKYGPISFYENDIEYKKYVGIALDKGILQVGYDANSFQQLIDNRIVEFASNRHIGESGFVLVLNNDYHIIYAPEGIISSNNEQIDLSQYKPFSLQECSISDEKYLYSYDETEGYLILGLYPVQEAMRIRDISVYINVFIELIIFAFLYIMIYKSIDVIVVDKLQDFQTNLNKISNGELNTSIKIRSNIEFSELSDDINKTVTTLKKYISDAEQRIKTELDLANNIQKSSLPIVTPIISKRSDFKIAPFMATAKEVGGDFYDFYFTDRHTLNFAVADVSGKGIPAALFMMRAKTELRSLSENGFPVNEVLEKGNAALCDGNDAGMFVTCWQGRINLDNGEVTYANGGHNPPIIKRKNGDTFYLKEKVNFILGGMQETKYVLQNLKLESGDMIFIYTDGVTEATNSAKELYGEDRLLNYISKSNFDDMNDLCLGLKKDIDLFVKEAPQFDDITMLAFKYNGIIDTHNNDKLLRISNVKLNVECSDWKDAIRQASNLLARSGSVHESYADELIKTVDELGPYIVLLPGFALAHTEPGKKEVYRNDISLITLKKGVMFNSPNDPVRLVIAISCLDPDSHVQLLQSIATKLMDDSMIDQILECKDESEVIQLLKK